MDDQESFHTKKDETKTTGSEQKRPVDPASNPGPPSNPDIDEEAAAKGMESLDRVKPY